MSQGGFERSEGELLVAIRRKEVGTRSVVGGGRERRNSEEIGGEANIRCGREMEPLDFIKNKVHSDLL